MIWLVFWKNCYGQSFRGFVKSKARRGAIMIAQRKLQTDCIIIGCVQAYEHQITPQSITLNFENTSEYELFG